MVRLGIQIAFGRVRRKTAPTGSGWTVRLMRYKLLEMVLPILRTSNFGFLVFIF